MAGHASTRHAPRHPTPADSRPVLVVVEDDEAVLQRIRGELSRRYEADYQVLCQRSSLAALAELERLRAAGAAVAVVLADQWMPELTGHELLARVRALHPDAKRGMLIDFGAWGDPPTREAILRAMALGHIDYYVIKPVRAPDESFHQTITDFLYEWTRTRLGVQAEITLVGPQPSPRTHALHSLLTRNGVPHAFLAYDSPEGARVLAEAGVRCDGRPIVVMHDGEVLVDPSNADLAAAYGVSTELEGDEYDVVVIGAGPAGLAAAVYGASEGLRMLVVERESIGGQAGSSSLIRNYLGFARGIRGAELATRAYQQAWVFGTRFLLMREALALRREGDRHAVAMSDGCAPRAPAVVLATGVSYQRLGVPALEDLVGAGVFYGASVSEARALAGECAYVVGGGNSAGQAVMHLARYAARVVMVVRGASLDATMSSYLVGEIEAAPNVEVRYGSEIADGGGEGRLERVVIRDRATGALVEEPAAGLFLLIGARPHTAWLPDEIARDTRGYVLTGADALREGSPLQRPPRALETSLPGVFAVGDVRFGAVKRVASGVGEGSVVIPQVHRHLADLGGGVLAEPDARV